MADDTKPDFNYLDADLFRFKGLIHDQSYTFRLLAQTSFHFVVFARDVRHRHTSKN